MTGGVLSGLTKRCAELAGEAESLWVRLAQIGAGLGHLDAMIRQVDPEYDLGAIWAKRPRGPDAARPGERSRFILESATGSPGAGHDAGGRAAADGGTRTRWEGPPLSGAGHEACWEGRFAGRTRLGRCGRPKRRGW